MEPDPVAQHLRRLILHEADQRYSIQKGDEYYPAAEPLAEEDLADHLAGRRTLGIKLIQPRTQLVKAGALDLDAPSAGRADLEAALGTARQIQAAAAGLGLPTAIEFSGRRGWHVWLFTQAPLPAATMRGLLVTLADRAGCAGAEVFPAGDRISEDGRAGPGAKPLKLPCGLHQASGARAGFVGEGVTWGEDGRPVLPAQAPLLEAIEQAAPAQVLGALSSLAPPTSGAIGPEERLPDLTRLGEAEPACITWLREHGAPLDQPYNSVNLTLARYAVSRGLGEEAALVLAGEVAQATRPEHPTGKAEPQDKLRNFRSVLGSAQREPERYQFNCSYIRGSQELRREACSGRSCPAWPWPGEVTAAAPAPRQASPADTLAEREAIAYLIANPEEALPLALQQQIPLEAFLTLGGPDGEEPRHRIVWEAVMALAGQETRLSLILSQWETLQGAPVTPEQALWLETLTRAPACSRSTFERHLERLRETGLREVLARSLRAAEAGLKQGEALPATLDTLITSARQIQTREAASLLPMEDLTGEILRDLFTRPPARIETPSAWLNNALNGGWLPGRLYVLGAPPGSGKTTLAAWAADYAATQGTPVLYVSYEMSREQLYIYSLARLQSINSALIEGQRWKDGGFTEAETLAARIAEAARTYQEAIAPRITIMEAGPEVTPAALKGSIGQVRAQAGLEDSEPVLVIIDYLQCMSTGEEALDSGSNETQKASRLATALKQLARELGAAVIAISDITKQAYQEALKSGELNMGALRDSFKISHAADTILLLLSEDLRLPATAKAPAPAPRSQLQLVQERTVPNSYRARALSQVEGRYPLDPRLKASYARLSILKNRGGRKAEPLFVYERAYHRFDPIDLDAQAWEDEGAEDNGEFT